MGVDAAEDWKASTRDAEESPSTVAWITNNIGTIIGVLVLLWVIKKIIFTMQSRWFPYVMHISTKDEFVHLEELKRDHFASLSSIVSSDPELRKENSIRILEIGVGTGVNFPHYPEGSHLVVVDPNPNFGVYYNANRMKFSKIKSEEIIVTTGDQMSMIRDGSIDVVVVTIVLCSVDKIDEIMQEIRRVLASGGKFYFMEHIAEFDLEKFRMRRWLQDVFTWYIPVWPVVYDGCCLNRDPLPAIKSAGFSHVEAQKFYAPVPHWVFNLEKPNLKGIATK